MALRHSKAPGSAGGQPAGPGAVNQARGRDQASSYRSRSITFAHAATKSFTNFSFASSLA